MKDQKTGSAELDWFAFETRVRKLIHELLEPTVKRTIESKENYEEGKRTTERLEKKIRELEYAIYKSDSCPTVFEELHGRITDSEARRKALELQLNQEVSSLSSTQGYLGDRITVLEKEFTSFSSRSYDLCDQIEKHQHVIFRHREEVGKQLAEMQEERSHEVIRLDRQVQNFQEMIKNIDFLIETAREETRRQEGLIADLAAGMPQIRQDIEDLDKVKLNTEDFTEQLAAVKQESLHCVYSIEDVHRNLISTDNYIEKYLPIKIQNSITDTLKLVLDKAGVLRLYEVDSRLYRGLHEVVIRDDGVPSLNKRGFKIPEHSNYAVVSPRAAKQEKADRYLSYVEGMGMRASVQPEESFSIALQTATVDRTLQRKEVAALLNQGPPQSKFGTTKKQEEASPISDGTYKKSEGYPSP